MRSIPLTIVLLTLAGCSNEQPPAAIAPASQTGAAPIEQSEVRMSTIVVEPEREVKVSGPMAIGFFPPITQEDLDEDDGGLPEGYSHVGFALEDVKECLTPKKIDMQLRFTRSFLLRDGPNTHKYNFPSDWGHAVGIVLVDPGREPVVIYATAGPSSLIELAPQAAWKYFSEPKCKRFEE